jgi:transcriptional regulator with XRE-family HTH domain
MKDRPHLNEGLALKKARGGRKLREVAAALEISISRLQNWERGENAPKRDMWPKVQSVLGIDAAALYSGSESVKGRPEHAINPKAVMPLIREIRTKLNLLEAICTEPVSSAVMEKNGFSAKGKKVKV